MSDDTKEAVYGILLVAAAVLAGLLKRNGRLP